MKVNYEKFLLFPYKPINILFPIIREKNIRNEETNILKVANHLCGVVVAGNSGFIGQSQLFFRVYSLLILCSRITPGGKRDSRTWVDVIKDICFNLVAILNS